MLRKKLEERITKVSARISIFVFFLMAFEIMIMISPFAFFFYAVFNPIFHWLDEYRATSWLTTFFLPHMILPPTLFLKAVRVLGSVCFIAGSLTFIICALQVYLGKIFKWGIASRGLYLYIRHPQYLALAIWGIGMSILWPRFIVLASLSLMFVLYYFLAKDEERRMLQQYGKAYEDYMSRTGMFVPKRIEGYVDFGQSSSAKSSWRYAVVPLLIIGIVIGTGFLLRAVSLSSLSFVTKDKVTLVSLLPEDNVLSPNVLKGILRESTRTSIGLEEDKDYLGYVMPVDYIMQGMIADTGGESHLFKQHHTIAMISDWVLHPFQHLRASPSLHMAQMHHVDPAVARRYHCPIGLKDPGGDCDTCVYRRVILVEIEPNDGGNLSGAGVFSLGVKRVPISFVDINVETGEILEAVKVQRSTAWQDVPTPGI